MISVNEAIQFVENNSSVGEKKNLFLIDALNHILSKDIISPMNMPPFRQSAMDGYALHIQKSGTYTIIDEVKAGDGHHPTLNKGEAVRIFTGAAVPDSANAVVMQEKVTVVGSELSLQKPVLQEENIRKLGEQAQKGAIALRKGTKLTPAGIGYLGSLGITKVEVYKKPTIAIVTTGNELTEPGKPLEYGKIYESNSIMLASVLNTLGFLDYSIHKVADNYQDTRTLLRDVISSNNMVIVTGGISVGDYDFVGKALEEIMVEQIFYKVKQKPGKPLFFGKKENTHIFALPGNPAAALSCFYLYVYPSLQILSGKLDFSLPRVKAKSLTEYTRKGDRAHFLKAFLLNNEVQILDGQSSSMLQTFALANVLVHVPEEIEHIKIGDTIEVICLPN
ncbi:MAG: gephyrin-like molybdotransferase Glp [Cellulophaga sp.]